MKSSSNETPSTTGQSTWTRDLARDLFPGQTTPFHWTTLRAPAEAALRRTWANFGAAMPDGAAFWRRTEAGRVELHAALLAEAGQATLGAAAWLGLPPAAPQAGGLLARLRTQGTIRQVDAQVTAAAFGITALQAHTAEWLARVRGLRWMQADLLQVMEELEPQAQAVLSAYFTLRAGLMAAQAKVAALVPDSLAVYAGIEGLPSAEVAHALADLPRDDTSAWQAFLGRYGHRGPGEMRPDAQRWLDHERSVGFDVESLRITRSGRSLSEPARSETGLSRYSDRQLPAGATATQTAHQAREAALGTLDGGVRRRLEAALKPAQHLCRAADVAWDALAMVMAATQLWSRAAAGEALAAGLIGEPADVAYLELEELKQVATGEWHRGRSAEARDAVARRRAQFTASASETAATQPRPANSGIARGPAHLLPALPTAPPPPGAILLAAAADPGCAPYWLGSAALVVSAPDPWAHGVVVARSLGLPVVVGAAEVVAHARPGQTIAVDGATGQIILS